MLLWTLKKALVGQKHPLIWANVKTLAEMEQNMNKVSNASKLLTAGHGTL
jgi:hypothetical protein